MDSDVIGFLYLIKPQGRRRRLRRRLGRRVTAEFVTGFGAGIHKEVLECHLPTLSVSSISDCQNTEVVSWGVAGDRSRRRPRRVCFQWIPISLLLLENALRPSLSRHWMTSSMGRQSLPTAVSSASPRVPPRPEYAPDHARCLRHECWSSVRVSRAQLFKGTYWTYRRVSVQAYTRSDESTTSSQQNVLGTLDTSEEGFNVHGEV